MRSQHLTPTDRAMLILPVAYCYGASVLHRHLAVGGQVVLDRCFMFPAKVMTALAEHQCTRFAGVVPTYRTLVAQGLLGLDRFLELRRRVQAGGGLDGAHLRRVRELTPAIDFYVMYGQIEATARITTLDPAQAGAHPGGVGRPLANIELRVVDEAGEVVARGVAGELLVHGPAVSAGYLGGPIATAAKFPDGWLWTGDLGHLDEQGFVYIDGRRDGFVKMRGLRVGLAEIEGGVARLELVADVAATAIADRDAGEAVLLFVVARQRSATAESLLAAIRQVAPPHWAIAGVVPVDGLPQTPSGKIDRQDLARRAQAGIQP